MKILRNTRSGFTLVEMLGVLFIIAMLVGILFPTIAKVRQRAKVALAQTQIETLSVALRMFESDLGTYPPDTGVVTPNDGATSAELFTNLGRVVHSDALNIDVGPYMEFKVGDLSPGNAYLDPWKRGYVYASRNGGNPNTLHNRSSFDLHSFGPDGQGDTPDDITNW